MVLIATVAYVLPRNHQRKFTDEEAAKRKSEPTEAEEENMRNENERC